MRILRNRSGQAAIVIFFSFILIFSILAITINLGIYIHDKINLQNAADAGAYAGAAEQARILQEVGYANYEIRQLYKRLVYDYRYRFSIDSDRDPVVSPSICVNFPFCDCIIPVSNNPMAGPVGYGIVNPGSVCGSDGQRAEEMFVDTHGSGKYIHQMPWNVNVPYDCQAQTNFNQRQALEIKNYYEAEFRNLIRAKLPDLMDLINADNGRAEKIARQTIKANLTWGNSKAEITFPKAPKVKSAYTFMAPGSRLSLIQPNRKTFRLYYTTWTAVGPKPWCFFRGKPNCTIYTCVRHHAGAYVDMDIPLWFLKDPGLTTYFATRLERKKTDFAFPFQYSRTAPRMSAASAAKPFGSSLGWPDKYSQESIVPELYVRDDNTSPGGVPNKFENEPPNVTSPSYTDFMEAFYFFDDPAYQSLTGEFMPIPLLSSIRHLNRLHFTFDSESFTGMSNAHDRVRFETSWPYDPKNGVRGRSGYSVKFIAIRDLGTRYSGNPDNFPENEIIDH